MSKLSNEEETFMEQFAEKQKAKRAAAIAATTPEKAVDMLISSAYKLDFVADWIKAQQSDEAIKVLIEGFERECKVNQNEMETAIIRTLLNIRETVRKPSQAQQVQISTLFGAADEAIRNLITYFSDVNIELIPLLPILKRLELLNALVAPLVAEGEA